MDYSTRMMAEAYDTLDQDARRGNNGYGYSNQRPEVYGEVGIDHDVHG